MSEFLSDVTCHCRGQVKLYPGLIAWAYYPRVYTHHPSGLIVPSPVFTCRSRADSSFEGFCFWCSDLGCQECSHAVCWLQLAGGLEPIQMAVKCLCETEMAEQWIISPWRAQKLMQTVTLRRQAEEHEDIKPFFASTNHMRSFQLKVLEICCQLPSSSPKLVDFSEVQDVLDFFQNMWELVAK